MALLNQKRTHCLRKGTVSNKKDNSLTIVNSSRWGPELMGAFDLSEISKREERKEKRSDNREKVPDIKEPDVKVTKDNACSIM